MPLFAFRADVGAVRLENGVQRHHVPTAELVGDWSWQVCHVAAGEVEVRIHLAGEQRKLGVAVGARRCPLFVGRREQVERRPGAVERVWQQVPVGAVDLLDGRAHEPGEFEQADAGALPICSATANYAAWQDRFTPSPSTPAEWLEAVQWAVANRDEVRELAAEARAYVLAERSIDRTIGLWREACAEPASVPLVAATPA